MSECVCVRGRGGGGESQVTNLSATHTIQCCPRPGCQRGGVKDLSSLYHKECGQNWEGDLSSLQIIHGCEFHAASHVTPQRTEPQTRANTS